MNFETFGFGIIKEGDPNNAAATILSVPLSENTGKKKSNTASRRCNHRYNKNPPDDFIWVTVYIYREVVDKESPT